MGWVQLAGAAISLFGGALMADDNGAEAANNAAANATALQAQIAREQWERYKEIYEPLERQAVAEAQDYASPENYAKAAGEASAAVGQQFSKARERLTRTPGLDPSSGAYHASLVGLDLAQAANDATQQNLARKNVSDTAYARKHSALALGKGLDTAAASGLAASASSNLALAQAGNQQAGQQAAALGRITERIIGSPSMSNWLNDTSATIKQPAVQVDTNRYFNSGTTLA